MNYEGRALTFMNYEGALMIKNYKGIVCQHFRAWALIIHNS